MTASAGEEAIAWTIKVLHLPPAEREYPFHPARKWRFDFAWPALMVACEVEGGVWAPVEGQRNSRHLRGAGFEEDCTKYGEAAILGWTVLRMSTQMAEDGRGGHLLERLLAARTTVHP